MKNDFHFVNQTSMSNHLSQYSKKLNGIFLKFFFKVFADLNKILSYFL